MDFNACEHTVDGVGVFPGELLGFFERVCLDHNETAGLVGERSGKYHPAGLIKRFHVRQMGGPVNFSFGFTVWTIKADDDEFHSCRAGILGRSFQRATVFVAGGSFMPPFDFRLAVFPTQEYDTAVSKVGKITEPEINVLDNDAHFLDGLKI